MTTQSSGETARHASILLADAPAARGASAAGAQTGKMRLAAQTRRRMALVVLGMHRSGTSALTRVFSLLGAQLPETLLGANESNPTGHWESDAVRAFNDAALDAAGTDWFDWLPVHEGWSRSIAYAGEVERGRGLLRAEYGQAPLFVLKDPRMCRLAGFWLDVLDAEGVDAAIVMPLRNPLEVAASLERRDGVDAQVALLVWLRHVLDAEAATRGRVRMVVRHDDMLDHWGHVAGRAERELGVVWPRAALGAGDAVETFLAPELRHHHRSDRAVVDNPLVSRWVRRAYAILLEWARDGERAGDHGELDAIRAALDEAGPGFAQPLRRLARQRAELADMARQRVALEARMADLNAQLARGEQARGAAEQGLAEAARAFQQAQAQLDAAALREGRDAEAREAMVRGMAELRAQAEAQQAHAEVQQAQAQAQAAALEAEIGHLRAALGALQQRAAELEGALIQRQDELEQTCGALEAARQHAERREADQEAAHQAAHQAARDQALRHAGRLARGLERERKGRAELNARLAQVRRELAHAQRQAGQERAAKARMREEMASQRQLLADQAAELDQAMEQVASLVETLTALRAAHADQGAAMESARAAHAREMATLTRLLHEAEEEGARAREALAQGRQEWEVGQRDGAETLHRHEARISDLERARDEAQDRGQRLAAQKADLERQLAERFGELATMARLIAEESERAQAGAAQADWLREAHRVMARRPRWWAIMPAGWQGRRLAQRLGFDGGAYLARHPDVAAQGMDPLRHYILFGMAEGRVRG